VCHNPILDYSLNFIFFQNKYQKIKIKVGNVEKGSQGINCNFEGNSRPNRTPLCLKIEKNNANSRSN